MNDKKLFEVNNDALQDVVGGQGGYFVPELATQYDVPENWADQHISVMAICPECHGMLDISTLHVPSGSSSIATVCPNCKKDITIML